MNCRDCGVLLTSNNVALTGRAECAHCQLLERVDDAIETALLQHSPVVDNECCCGARNNMDGDVLDSHRLGAVSDAVRAVLGGERNTVNT